MISDITRSVNPVELFLRAEPCAKNAEIFFVSCFNIIQLD